MAEARELQLILEVAEQLGEELGAATARSEPDSGERERPEAWVSIDPKDAQLITRLRGALAAIATAAPGKGHEKDDDGQSAERTATALARTELVVRGELTRGDSAGLAQQLPGFVFLVVLPTAGMDRALELANRTGSLLEERLS